jgi:hypothetical protein
MSAKADREGENALAINGAQTKHKNLRRGNNFALNFLRAILLSSSIKVTHKLASVRNRARLWITFSYLPTE